jgi:molybdopterin synthase catalytic subunit
MRNEIRICREPFDMTAEVGRLSAGAAAIVTFTGRVRAEDGLTALTLEHYPDMTEHEIASHVAEAAHRWPLQGVTVIHRVGTLKPEEPIVLVAVAANHRREAFAACEFLMDYLKTRAPFWKQETKGADTHWVEAKPSDDQAAERWKK